MTAAELKIQMSKETIWMASEAIRQGCEAARKTKQESLKQEALQAEGAKCDFALKHAYFDGVRVASEILWRLFDGYSAAIQSAICKTAKEIDVNAGLEDYFDVFVCAYKQECGIVKPRIFL